MKRLTILLPLAMRVVECGTGMPNARPKQASACFLVELGNMDGRHGFADVVKSYDDATNREFGTDIAPPN